MLPMEKDKAAQKSVCQMVCLIVLQFTYLMIGSAVFMALERDNSQEAYKSALVELKKLRKNLDLTRHQERVLQNAFGKGFTFHAEELPDEAKHAWDFISTLYFSITSTTTIGYGHHSPSTENGQWFCILFSLFGIPIHMITLTTLGRHLNNLISRVINWAGGRWIRKKQFRKDVGTFCVTTCLLILFTMFSAGSVRLIIDDVSLTQAIYFIYVTISTIGFGDFVIRFEDQDEHSRILILCLWALAVYVGMTILSATIRSLSARTKKSYKTMFGFWDRKVLGKTFKSPAKRKRRYADEDEEGLIMVDKAFLIAQLDLQTDPSKRAEIQKWIDLCIETSDCSSYESYESDSYEFEYSPPEKAAENPPESGA